MTASFDFRALTRHYIAHPDPLAWMAAADWLEESGDTAGAHRWRRRAEWYPLLREAIRLARDVADRGMNLREGAAWVRLGPFWVGVGVHTLSRYNWNHVPSIQVRWFAEGIPAMYMKLVWYAIDLKWDPADGERYDNRRTIELVDRLVEVEAKGR